MGLPSAISLADDFVSMYVRPKEGRTLIVGSRVYRTRTDRRKQFVDVEGWDMLDGEGVDRVVNLEEPLPVDAGQFAHVECVSVLEHSRAPWLLAANVERLLVGGGTLFVEAPFIWRVHDYPDDYWRFTKDAIALLFPSIQWAALQYGRNSAVKNKKIDEVVYLPRTEVFGFGHKP